MLPPHVVDQDRSLEEALAEHITDTRAAGGRMAALFFIDRTGDTTRRHVSLDTLTDPEMTADDMLLASRQFLLMAVAVLESNPQYAEAYGEQILRMKALVQQVEEVSRGPRQH